MDYHYQIKYHHYIIIIYIDYQFANLLSIDLLSSPHAVHTGVAGVLQSVFFYFLLLFTFKFYFLLVNCSCNLFTW